MLAVLSMKRNLDTTTLTSTGERKPFEGECPICFQDFGTNKKTTWCQSCGSNFHDACFKTWKTTMYVSNDVVHCLYW
ncbi:Zinc finger, RING-type [Penicillium italicum]|uniref:Zinc finger, RING-type n=1 Tax=Penicillium italicum TaxID=40296 RepID=A0A0A2KNE8_PENIT|nr:Zinc finger, RING-type [Penicillium italicum]